MKYFVDYKNKKLVNKSICNTSTGIIPIKRFFFKIPVNSNIYINCFIMLIADNKNSFPDSISGFGRIKFFENRREEGSFNIGFGFNNSNHIYGFLCDKNDKRLDSFETDVINFNLSKCLVKTCVEEIKLIN